MSNPVEPALSRRTFLSTAAGAGMAAVFPATSRARAQGANDRLRVGVIGAGGRGRYVMQLLQRQPGVEIVALCDVFQGSLAEARKLVTTAGPRMLGDHRELLDDRTVDAVLIATPDHWHAPMTIDAVRAGKDVYLEKPIAHSIEEGRAIVRAAAESGRVVQVGLQQRSGPHYVQAKQAFFDSGRIGEVGHVRTWWHGQNPRALNPALDRRPDGLDWERFVGPARAQPFNPRRFYQWRNYADFGEGQVGDLFTHWVDVVHWFVGESLPSAASAIGGVFHFPDGRDWPDTVSLLLEYPGGWSCAFEASLAPGASGWGTEFFGTGGRLFIDRNRYTFTPAGSNATPETRQIEGDITTDHVRDFVESVRTRRKPSSDPLSAHHSALASHLANLSYTRKERVVFDRSQETALPSP